MGYEAVHSIAINYLLSDSIPDRLYRVSFTLKVSKVLPNIVDIHNVLRCVSAQNINAECAVKKLAVPHLA